MFQESVKGFSEVFLRVSEESSKGILKQFLGVSGGFKEVARCFMKFLRSCSKEFARCFRKVSWLPKGDFKDVSRVFPR